MDEHTQTAEIYRNRVRIESLEVAFNNNLPESLQRIERLENALTVIMKKCAIMQLEQRVKHLEDAPVAVIRACVSAGWTGSTLSYAALAIGMDCADLDALGLPYPSYLADQEVKP